MTATIGSIRANNAGLEAICQEPGCKNVTTLALAKYGDHIPVCAIEARLKCTECGERNVRIEGFAKGHGGIVAA